MTNKRAQNLSFQSFEPPLSGLTSAGTYSAAVNHRDGLDSQGTAARKRSHRFSVATRSVEARAFIYAYRSGDAGVSIEIGHRFDELYRRNRKTHRSIAHLDFGSGPICFLKDRKKKKHNL